MSRPATGSFRFVCDACRSSIRRRAPIEARQFSTTRPRHSKALPAFSATSSSELDGLLSTIRMKYFLPAYLSEQQRKVIRSDKLKSQLENDPMYATLVDEEIRLEHLDITKDMPSKGAFMEAVDMFQTAEDWKNLPSLLEGYHKTKAKLHDRWLYRMINAAREAGQMNIIVRCLAQVRKNGLTMKTPVVREQVLLGIRRTAADEQWETAGFALKKVEEVLRLMENAEHCGSRKVTDQDPRAEPFVIAIPLEMTAKYAIKKQKGADEDGKIELYSTRLIAALAQQQSALNSDAPWTLSQGLSKPVQIKTEVETLDLLVSKFLAVRNALRLAQRIRGSSWAEDEKAYAAHLQSEIEKKISHASEQVEGLSAGGKLDYEHVAIPGLEEWRAQK